MAEQTKKPESNRSQQPPPPPPVNTGTLGAKSDGTPDPEVGGHMDRSVPAPGAEEASQGALEKASLAIKNLVTGKPDVSETGESEVAPLPPSSGIAVIATRDGFYRQQRLVEGDRFNIAGPEDWGDWMKLADEKEEEKRMANARKAKMLAQQEELKAIKADQESKAKLAGF